MINDSSKGQNNPSATDVTTPEASGGEQVPQPGHKNLESVGPAVPVPLPLWKKVYHSIAFALSALLSPYLVIPVGTVGVVSSVSQVTNSRRTFLLWTSLSIFFSTAVPAIYVVIQILRGKITDVHVMEREQRGGPFLVAMISSAIGAIVLNLMGTPPQVWGIGVVLAVNGIVLSWITRFWKISLHVAVLSATLLAVLIIIPNITDHFWSLVWLIPALIWARSVRGRHTVWQGLAATAVSCFVTSVTLFSVDLGPRIVKLFNRYF